MGRPKRYDTNADKQKAYRMRKRLSGVGVTGSREAVEAERCQDQAEPGSTALPSKSKIEELRELIETESRRVVEEPAKPLIYRNDFGGIITERQWKTLQEKKRRALEGGYILDEWSQ